MAATKNDLLVVGGLFLTVTGGTGLIFGAVNAMIEEKPSDAGPFIFGTLWFITGVEMLRQVQASQRRK